MLVNRKAPIKRSVVATFGNKLDIQTIQKVRMIVCKNKAVKTTSLNVVLNIPA